MNPQSRYNRSTKGRARNEKYKSGKRFLETRSAYWQSYAYKAARQKKWRSYKITTLSHYGKGGKLQCCWRGCSVVDLDMLTLDHIAENGSQNRRDGREPASGSNFYRWLERKGFPEGFQTLCWNHQWKKRIKWLEEKLNVLRRASRS